MRPADAQRNPSLTIQTMGLRAIQRSGGATFRRVSNSTGLTRANRKLRACSYGVMRQESEWLAAGAHRSGIHGGQSSMGRQSMASIMQRNLLPFCPYGHCLTLSRYGKLHFMQFCALRLLNPL
jgi:hypothetical protein